MLSDMCAELGQHEGVQEPAEKSELWIANVRLPPSRVSSEEERYDYDGTWIVKCSDGFVTDVLRTPEPGHIASMIDNVQILDANGGIMIPSSVSSMSPFIRAETVTIPTEHKLQGYAILIFISTNASF